MRGSAERQLRDVIGHADEQNLSGRPFGGNEIEASTVCRESWSVLFNIRRIRAGGCGGRSRDRWRDG